MTFLALFGIDKSVKITVRRALNNDKKTWFVDYTPPGGKRRRVSFATKTLAEAHAEELRAEHSQAGEIWLGLDARERSEVVSVLAEVKGAGLTLRSVWDRFRRSGPRAGISKPLGEAFTDFMLEKKAARLSTKAETALRSNVGRFIQGREEMPVNAISRQDVIAWLTRPDWGPRTFNTYRVSLSTFFRWCKHLGYLSEPPTDTIKPIDERRMPDLDVPPAILSLYQCKRLLRAVLATDKGLVPYVALGLFAGLRPEREAAKLTKADIQDELIQVRGLHAKDRQRRIVPVHPTLKLWLDLGGDYHPKNLRRRFERVRELAGLIRRDKVPGRERKQVISTGWEQDCLRHTFASHYLPMFGVDKTVEALGHGDYDMLFQHYRALVTPDEAAEYWKLTPGTVRDYYSKKAGEAKVVRSNGLQTLKASACKVARSRQ